jgi:hypothetical protein
MAETSKSLNIEFKLRNQQVRKDRSLTQRFAMIRAYSEYLHKKYLNFQPIADMVRLRFNLGLDTPLMGVVNDYNREQHNLELMVKGLRKVGYK